MPLDTAINNIGEYYAAHYLESQFAKDIADKLKAWRDLGTRAIPRRLQALGNTYFKAKSQALDFDITTQRMLAAEGELAHWHDRVLRELGYEPAPTYLPLMAEKSVLPVLVRLSRYREFHLGGSLNPIGSVPAKRASARLISRLQSPCSASASVSLGSV